MELDGEQQGSGLHWGVWARSSVVLYLSKTCLDFIWRPTISYPRRLDCLFMRFRTHMGEIVSCHSCQSRCNEIDLCTQLEIRFVLYERANHQPSLEFQWVSRCTGEYNDLSQMCSCVCVYLKLKKLGSHLRALWIQLKSTCALVASSAFECWTIALTMYLQPFYERIFSLSVSLFKFLFLPRSRQKNATFSDRLLRTCLVCCSWHCSYKPNDCRTTHKSQQQQP